MEQLRLQLEATAADGNADELMGSSSLGDDLETEKLTAAMKAKLGKYDALRAENEELASKLDSLSTVCAQCRCPQTADSLPHFVLKRRPKG